METIYHQNPLRSQTILDERDKEFLRAKLSVERLEEAIYAAQQELSKETPDVTQALKELNVTEADDETINRYAEYLKGWHAGDCTSIPCSCMKCYVEEELLGFSTIEGLSKGMGNKLDSVYGGPKFDRTIDEAIELLKIPISETPNEHYKGNEDLYTYHRPRWENDRLRALEWLIEYKQKHFTIK